MSGTLSNSPQTIFEIWFFTVLEKSEHTRFPGRRAKFGPSGADAAEKACNKTSDLTANFRGFVTSPNALDRIPSNPPAGSRPGTPPRPLRRERRRMGSGKLGSPTDVAGVFKRCYSARGFDADRRSNSLRCLDSGGQISAPNNTHARSLPKPRCTDAARAAPPGGGDHAWPLSMCPPGPGAKHVAQGWAGSAELWRRCASIHTMVDRA